MKVVVDGKPVYQGQAKVYKVPSRSRDLTHTVTVYESSSRERLITCTCEGYSYNGGCWHVDEVKEKLMPTGRSATEQMKDDPKNDPKNWRTCLICGGTFVGHHMYQYQRIRIPEEVCMWCYTRGYGRKGSLYWKWMRMKNALDAIGKTPCIYKIKGDEPPEVCKCASCYARRVHDEVYPPKEEETVAVPDGEDRSEDGQHTRGVDA